MRKEKQAHCKSINDYMTKDMRNGVLKIVILNMIKNGNYYPYLLFQDIKKNGPKFVFSNDIKNNIYNTLQALENGSYIKARHVIEKDRSKKYYSITKKGAVALNKTHIMMNRAIKEAMNMFE